MLPLPGGPPWAPRQLDSRTVYDVCLLRTTSVLDQNDDDNRVVHALCRGFRSRFRRDPLAGVFDHTSCSARHRLVSRWVLLPILVRTGQAFTGSPCGRVACTHGDRLVAFVSGGGTTRLPCGHVVARVRGARRAHVRTPWRQGYSTEVSMTLSPNRAGGSDVNRSFQRTARSFRFL